MLTQYFNRIDENRMKNLIGWMRGCGQTIAVPLCHSFLLTLFSCPSMGSSMGCCREMQKTTCSTVVSKGCRGFSALAPGTPPPLFLLWPWCSQGCIIHFSLTPHGHAISCHFLSTFSPEHHHLGCLAQPCPMLLKWAVEVGWNHLCPQWGSPSPFSQKPPCSSCARNALAPTSNSTFNYFRAA